MSLSFRVQEEQPALGAARSRDVLDAGGSGLGSLPRGGRAVRNSRSCGLKGRGRSRVVRIDDARELKGRTCGSVRPLMTSRRQKAMVGILVRHDTGCRWSREPEAPLARVRQNVGGHTP